MDPETNRRYYVSSREQWWEEWLSGVGRLQQHGNTMPWWMPVLMGADSMQKSALGHGSRRSGTKVTKGRRNALLSTVLILCGVRLRKRKKNDAIVIKNFIWGKEWCQSSGYAVFSSCMCVGLVVCLPKRVILLFWASMILIAQSAEHLTLNKDSVRHTRHDYKFHCFFYMCASMGEMFSFYRTK